MKLQSIFFSLACASLLLIGCEQDQIETEEESVDLTTQINLNAKEQSPSVIFDTSNQGVYLGIVANKNSQKRGKIWVNLGNNTAYTAILEMVDGTKASFTGSENLGRKTGHFFTGKAGSFTITTNDVNNPEITNMSLNNEAYFGRVIKSTSTNRATAYTGTFNSSTAGFTGTWNLLSNGLIDPNGFNGTAISETVVTLSGGGMFVDMDMEIGGAFGCGNTSTWVPIVDFNMTPGDGVLAFEQQSTINGGVTTWDFGFSTQVGPIGSTYVNQDCMSVLSGTFSWTHPVSGVASAGDIFIDIAP